MLPHLRKLLDLKRRVIDCFDGYEHPYDVMLDDFERGMTVAQVRPVLTELREGLARPARADRRSRVTLDDSCLHGDVRPGRPAAPRAGALRVMPLRDGGWRLDETTHPFADLDRAERRPAHDAVRARLPRARRSGRSSTRRGTAIYESGMPDALRRTPVGAPRSLGLARVAEPPVGELGRPRPAVRWRPAARCSREHFPERVRRVDGEGLYRAGERGQALADPRRGRRGHLQPPHRHPLRARGRALRGEPRARGPARGLERALRGVPGPGVPDDAEGVMQDVHWTAAPSATSPRTPSATSSPRSSGTRAPTSCPTSTPARGAASSSRCDAWLDQRLYPLAGRFDAARDDRARHRRRRSTSSRSLAHLEQKYGELYGWPERLTAGLGAAALAAPSAARTRAAARSISRPKALSTASVMASSKIASSDSAASGRRRSMRVDDLRPALRRAAGLVERLPDLLEEEVDEGPRDAVGVAAELARAPASVASGGTPSAASSRPAARQPRAALLVAVRRRALADSPSFSARSSSSGSPRVAEALRKLGAVEDLAAPRPRTARGPRAVKRRTSALRARRRSIRRRIASRLKPSAWSSRISSIRAQVLGRRSSRCGRAPRAAAAGRATGARGCCGRSCRCAGRARRWSAPASVGLLLRRCSP